MEFGPDTLENDLSGLDTAAGTGTGTGTDDNVRALRDMPRTPVDVAERADLALEDDRIAGPAQSTTPGQPTTVPRYLSPSSSSMFEQCARKWKFRYLDKLPDPPGEAALAGTFAHRVLELLLQLPAEQRTEEEAKRLARAVWPETAQDLDFIALRMDEQTERAFRWRGWQAVQGLWAIEDPSTVTVHATEHDVKVKISDVPFRGIVDRIDVADDALVISDYKSGRAPRPRYAADKLKQVLLYAAAVREMMGQAPSKARLLYLGQTIIDVDVTEDNLAEVEGTLSQTWDALQTACSSETFDASTGPLCAWCPFVKQCPEGIAEVSQRHAAGMVRPDAPGLVVLPISA